jgi:ubiquinone/menaquinone biosynthesis C-methylase UbiE
MAKLKLNNKIKIPKQTRERIRKLISKQYVRYARIEPYYIPLFGRIYWQRLERVLQLALREVAERDAYIADLGCGFGVFVALLGKTFGAYVVGIDEYPAGPLKVAQDICGTLSSSQCSFVRGDIFRLAFQSNVFHSCFCLDVLEVPNVEDCLEERHRVLKANGSFFATVPVEGKVLNIAREITSLHGRRRATSPHWRGTVANYRDLKRACLIISASLKKSTSLTNCLHTM